MENALRILHVVEDMNHGDPQKMLMNVYQNIDRTKIQFDFLTSAEGEYDNQIKKMGGHIYQIPSIHNVGVKGYRNALRHFFKGHRFYIVMHAHMDQMSTFSLKAAKKVGIPIRIAHSHNTATEGTANIKTFSHIVGAYVPYYATHYFACSSEAASWLFKGKAKHTEIIQNAIEIERFYYSPSQREQTRQDLHIKDNQFIIGHVGRFSTQKNHDYLIELFVGFRRKIPQSKLILIGDGPRKKDIEDKITQYHLKEHVILLGERADIEKWMQSFDLFVFPSLHEGMPLTLIEAQSAGLSILASDRVSKEADLGADLLTFLPLEKKLIWLDEMYKAYGRKLRNPVDAKLLMEKGYDVRQVARETEEKYLQLRDDGINASY